MAGLSLAAIGAGIGVAVILSALVGLVFGAAVIADTHPDDDDPEAALDAAMASPGAGSRVRIAMALATLPVTLAGAWGLTAFTG